MDGVISMEDARALVGDAKLWPRVRGFLWDFAPQIHMSWLDDFTQRSREAESAETLVHSAISASLREMKSPRVKRYILESLGVEPCFHTFPKEDGSRILLLDGATLESAAKWLGALACAESLRRVTSGEVVRGLRTKLRGIYPEVFGYTAYFKDLDSRGGAEARSEDIVAEVVANGYGLLFSAFSKLPASVVSRAKFKLPKDLRVSASPREIDLPVVLKLFKLKFPEAYKLCC
ncbi:MAG: hypothetical protein II840_09265 [Kiritimatiellae bacterium]|nr:hypothetical protein [Kiritimatiellia bacterium]